MSALSYIKDVLWAGGAAWQKNIFRSDNRDYRDARAFNSIVFWHFDSKRQEGLFISTCVPPGNMNAQYIYISHSVYRKKQSETSYSTL